MAAERRFPVMGTTAHVTVVPRTPAVGVGLLDAAEARLAELERRWSRFIPDSEVSRCNAAAGESVEVSRDTQLLFERALDGWERTAGRFDPTVLPALVAAGYDDTFEVVAARATQPELARGVGAAPGCWGVRVDRGASTVTVPAGVGFDPGGVGKGLAADLVAEELAALGAVGVCVNVGGDLRSHGDGPDGAGWVVALEHPLDDGNGDGNGDLGSVHLASGAVASTWRTRRSWGTADDRRHHVIDPERGMPADTSLAGVVAITRAAWWAEVLATAAFLSGDGACALIEAHGAAGLAVADDGVVHAAGSIEALRPCWA